MFRKVHLAFGQVLENLQKIAKYIFVYFANFYTENHTAAQRYKISLLVLKKTNFVSPHGHVISSILLKLIKQEICWDTQEDSNRNFVDAMSLNISYHWVYPP